MNKSLVMIMALGLSLCSCNDKESNESKVSVSDTFDYHVDRFYDLEILRYQVPGFDKLELNQKILIYYLQKAALEGRDILFDQNCKYNLPIRKTLELVYLSDYAKGNAEQYSLLEKYLKRVWFSNGIHHHYSTDKFLPEFTKEYFCECVKTLPSDSLPLEDFSSDVNVFLETLTNVMFDPSVLSKRVNQAEGADLISTSANNYYLNLTQSEVESYYDAKRDSNDQHPVSYGLNSRLCKGSDNKLFEEVWKVGGKYSREIEKIVYWLKKAEEYAENEQQKLTIQQLISYYQTGDLKTFDEYSITWVKDSVSRVDFVNGFIETYGDPLGLKASWESIVNFKDIDATHRTEVLSQNAQWFEDNSPVDPKFKKKECKGVSAKVITAAILAGDCYPATPIGINLPNANWIREVHGSKSVTIENITFAYDQAAKGNGFKEEFVYSDEERKRIETYGFRADNIHTDLHECLGHGSGQLLPGVSQDALKSYGATIEEARADLFGLYYAADSKMVELGMLPDTEAYKSEYYTYMMNGLMTQLVRIKPGDNIEESHMRNRSLIAHWVEEKGRGEKIVEFVNQNGKTFVKINDYSKLRTLFGELLKEIQRIKSEGDYEAAKNLVEKYGVKVDSELHKEVLSRYEKLNLAPYKGFVNPVYELVEEDGKIKDVKVRYDEGYTDQMLRYSRENSVVE